MLTAALGLENARVVALCGSGGKTTLMFALARELVAAGERVLITTTTKMAREEADGWPCFAASSAQEVIERARHLLPRPGGGSGALMAYSHLGHDGHRLAGFAPDLVDELAGAGEFDHILVEADGSARKPLKAPARHEPVIPAATVALVIVAGLNGLGLPLSEENLFRPEIWSRLSGLEPGSPITPESLARCVAHPEGLARGSPAGARRTLFLNQADTPQRRLDAMQVMDCLATMPECGLARIVAGTLLPQPGIADVLSFAGR